MIKIFNNKITYTSHRNKKHNVPNDVLFKYLGEHVELDEKVTFKRIMELFMINEELTNTVFAHTLGNYPFVLFYDDFKKSIPAEEMKDYHYDHKKQYLEVYYQPDVSKHDVNERFEWNNSYDIHLIEIGDKENMPYGIMLSKLGAFQKHKIKIKLEVDIHAHDSTKKITKKSLTTPLIKAKLGGMKLYDFLWAILYEISWMGSPEHRDSESKRLSKTVDDIKEGKMKTVEWKTGDTLDDLLAKVKK